MWKVVTDWTVERLGRVQAMFLKQYCVYMIYMLRGAWYPGVSIDIHVQTMGQVDPFRSPYDNMICIKFRSHLGKDYICTYTGSISWDICYQACLDNDHPLMTSKFSFSRQTNKIDRIGLISRELYNDVILI